MEKIHEIIELFIDNNRTKDNFKILVSDEAGYYLQVGRLLKEKISNLKYIICLAHNLHNLASKISNYYVNTSLFANFLLKYLKTTILTKKFTKKPKN